MRKTLVLLILLLPFSVSAQQTNMGPDPMFGTSPMVLSALEFSGDYLLSGRQSQQALVTRVEPTSGLTSWTWVCDDASDFRSSAFLPNGNFVSAGIIDRGNTDGLISVFTPGGSMVWTKSFGTDTTEVPNSVDSDPSGNIYVVGRKGFSQSREIAMKLDPDGNVVWATQLLGIGDARKVHYRGGSIFVLGSTFFANQDISLSVYDASTGALLVYKVFGGPNAEIYLDGAMNEEGIFFTFATQGSNIGVAKINWSTLLLQGDPMFIFPSNGSSLFQGALSLDGPDIYVSGGSDGFGARVSFATKLNQSLAVVWGRYIVSSPFSFGAFGLCSLPMSDGTLAFVDNKNDAFSASVIITRLTKSSGVDAQADYCEPSTDGGFGILNGSFSVSQPTRTQISLNFQVGTSGYSVFGPEVLDCNSSPLPVELTMFQAQKSGKNVLLNWQTASEQNTSIFNLLRSQDGVGWEKIGSVSAAGESHQLRDYSFVDDAPQDGDNYYKLESVDMDGTSEVSDVVVVHFDGRRQDMVVYPNPSTVGDALNVKGDFQSVVAFDQLGRSVPVQRNGNQLVFQEKVGSGMYILTFFDADGATETVRVVVQ